VTRHSLVTPLDDLRSTILGLLFPEQPPAVSRNRFGGVDLSREKRELAFIQNKFALQDENARPGETRKSYAVTDGRYRLSATSPNPATGQGGLELYLDEIDPMNCSNLLGFMELNDQGQVS
jgi:hypothetical protein